MTKNVQNYQTEGRMLNCSCCRIQAKWIEIIRTTQDVKLTELSWPKKLNIWKAKFMSIRQTVRINILGLYRGKNWFQKHYHDRSWKMTRMAICLETITVFWKGGRITFDSYWMYKGLRKSGKLKYMQLSQSIPQPSSPDAETVTGRV